MKIFFLLLCCILLVNSHIYSSTPGVTYDINGNPLIYHLYVSLEYGLGASDYMQLVWPQLIHNPTKPTVQVKLITFSNNLQVSSTYVQADSSNVDSNYYMTFGYDMQPNSWYEIQIFPTKTPITLTGQLIQLITRSSKDTNAIIYDANYAFGYVNIQNNLATAGGVGSLVIASTSVSSDKNRAAAIYTITISITPTKTQLKGGNFTLQLYYDVAVPTHASGTTLIDFSFMGLCQAVPASVGATAAVLNYCSISSDLSTITFSLNQVAAGQVITISTQVSNPLYKSVRGIQGYWVQFISGIVQENGKLPLALQVYKIGINDLGTDRVYFLWGIQSSFTDAGNGFNAIPIFKMQTSTPSIIPYNSFNIGFSFNDTSPVSGLYYVLITLEAMGVLQGSIVHNFPAYSGLKVYCYLVVNKIRCDNVGAFISSNYRYFISGKAFFNSSLVSSITTFGDIQVNPVVLDASGSALTVSLYTTFSAGQTISIQSSRGYLDLDGSKQYHNTLGNFKIGNAQVISLPDDNTLSSTADAMQSLFSGTNNTIGVIPDMGSSQQLVFLLQTNAADIDLGGGNAYTMQLIYNNKVIGFEDDNSSTRGLDFVGYQNSTGNWSIQYSPCYQAGNVVCEKYNADTPLKNVQVRVNTANANNFYGMYKFSCGTAFSGGATCGGACVDECTMFRGWGNTDLMSSVMSMRKVTFPANYYSSLYADVNLLDFIIIFYQGGSKISMGLINAYTIVGNTLTNVKASYVNYWDYTSTQYNKGSRVPMMLRIGGGILPQQSRGATVVGVFFDDNIDASTFYTSTGKSYAVGCSTGNCIYYPNMNLNLARNDNWHTNKRVEYYDIPSIQVQFNLLVPVTPVNHVQPTTLYIGFFAQNNTVNGVSGLLTTLSVYRLFGASVISSINGQILPINSLSRGNAVGNANADLSSPTSSSGYMYYTLNVSNIVLSPPDNMFSAGYSRPSMTYGQYYGAGITITSLYYNIFSSSTLAFESVPANTSSTCVNFGYIYNDITPAIAYKNKQWIYTVFCPIDSALDLWTAAANIHFTNPQYPNVFTSGFPLASVLTYGYSDQQGHLLDYRHQGSAIPTFTRSCTTSMSPQFMPQTFGKQRSVFSIITPQIQMKGDGYSGYPSFRVQIIIPTSTVASSGFVMDSACQVNDPLLSCSYVSGASSAYDKYFLISYTGTAIYTVTSFSLNLYATVATSGSNIGFGVAANYDIKIHLPQYNNNVYAPFGNNIDTSAYAYKTVYCTCSSTFTVGITGKGQLMTFGNLQFTSNMQSVRSTMSFDFGASSYRQTFFSSSTFKFNFGFLSTTASAYNTRGDFRCLVYENNNGSLTLSQAWYSLMYTSLSNVVLTPKKQISTPNLIKYTMKCFGSSVPTSSVTNMSLLWVDNSVSVQVATQIAPVTYLASTLPSLTFSTVYKRFRNEGFKSLYTFSVTAPFAMDQNSRIYLNFHSKIGSRLDKQATVECYTRSNLVIVDSQAVYTYCQFVDERVLSVWNNVNLAINAIVYIDVYNIEQPKLSDFVSNNQKITCTIDNDDSIVNGAKASTELTDKTTLPTITNTPGKITILSTSVSSPVIRSTQTITINIDMALTTVFAAGNNLYVELPFSYAEWIKRSTTLTTTTNGNCYIQSTGSGVNLATACVYISKRILKITVASNSNRYYTVILRNVNSPSKLPVGKDNQYRFKLYTVDSAAQNYITYYTFADFSSPLTLVTDTTLEDVSWNFYQISQNSEIINLNSINTQQLTIYTGYYSSVVQLLQGDYPNNFQSDMTLTINNYNSSYFFTTTGSFQVHLGYRTAYFRIAAMQNLPPGLYSLQFNKGGDSNSLYTLIPPLTLVVNNLQCSLATDSNSYLVPVNGSSLPIIIKGLNCIPITAITITMSFTFNSAASTELKMNTDLSSRTLNTNVLDGNLYFIVQHSGILPVGTAFTASFSIAGANYLRFATIPPITITLVNPTSYQSLPVATVLVSPSLNTNTAVFTLQCNQASTIYWGLGIYPSILNNQALDFQARIISSGTGLSTNFTEQDDSSMRVYGIVPVSTMQVLSKTLYNLKSNTNYIFKYFCKNQLGLISDSQSINFTSLNYGAYQMKVSITFRASINYGQFHDLSCSLAQNFKIPYARVMTQAMSYCNNKPYIFYTNDSSVIGNQPDSSGQYTYNFYILPDYTLPTDTTNINIRNSLSLHSFTSTIITSTNNDLSLPQLVQMQTADIQIFSTPTMTISDPISGLNSIIVSSAITNMNGFIVIGVMSGVFNATSMTLPTTNNIKKGLFEASRPLVQTKMLYITQNYNVTFEFAGLTDNTLYSLFYFATSQDPTLTATSSTVKVLYAQTLQALTVNINYESKLVVAFSLLIIFIISC